MLKKIFTEKIIDWYHNNKRLLPWRDTTDPYKIWLSEIILQQTRVAQGLPYYLRFIETFPDIVSLSAASEQEVLRTWQGLGYYTRARNLHLCSKIITEQFNGEFPKTFAGLLDLPGVGPYTAAAIASFAFNEVEAVVDGNVFRVLARHFGIDKDISLPETKKYFFDLANSLIDHTRPGDFNQAMMELGAICCTPQNPKCDECIFKSSCVAFATNTQAQLPLKSKKVKARKRYIYYLVLRQHEKLAFQKRTGKDIWQGLFDFHPIESVRQQNPLKVIEQSRIFEKCMDEIVIEEPSAAYKHLLSHQTLLVRFIPIRLKSKNSFRLGIDGQKIKFYSAEEAHVLPMPVLLTKYLNDIGFL